MPWQEKNTMKLRQEFVEAAENPGRSVAEVCREFGISRKTGYKWIKRHAQQGELGLCNRSRRPHSRPLETTAEMAMRVIELRREKPRRGPKKIRECYPMAWQSVTHVVSGPRFMQSWGAWTWSSLQVLTA